MVQDGDVMVFKFNV
ncbi:hypothetical protein KKH82_07460 [Patescibacteria group bacterium]|nr:hypothetical protein [Patescibacteria group bacterium]